uniref:Protein kinase domain-containing protein n=1 Tax=Arcella intermedia TaxID=1963864 RepID=A0A6B2L2I9_9EUKA
MKRYTTFGGFKAQTIEKQKSNLIQYATHEIQREFPHLAKGSYGIVFKGQVAGIAKKVVIKDMDIRDQRTVEEWKKELTVMSENQCSYICEVYGFSSSSNVLTIVMEYMPLGDLFGLLYKKSHEHPLSMLQRIRMGRHCALGIAYLHHNKVMHRDVKSLNVLVTEDYCCKLTDFGCAKLVSETNYLNTVNSGTPLWMAPEVKRGQYNFSADVYSLGLVLFELFEKKLPDFNHATQSVIIPPSFKSANVILPCLQPIPEKRPTAQQLVQTLEMSISNVVKNVSKLLPENEQKIVQDITVQSDDDCLERELVFLYRHLLQKPAQEVDKLIEEAFPTPPPQFTPQPQYQMQMQPQQYQPNQAPPMGYPPMGIPLNPPGFINPQMGIRYPYQQPQAQYHSTPMMQQPPYNPTIMPQQPQPPYHSTPMMQQPPYNPTIMPQQPQPPYHSTPMMQQPHYNQLQPPYHSHSTPIMNPGQQPNNFANPSNPQYPAGF